jgi:ATP-dependent DNA ligase
MRSRASLSAPTSRDLMLASLGDRPFSRRGWIFELKYDGFRVLTIGTHLQALLIHRNPGMRLFLDR